MKIKLFFIMLLVSLVSWNSVMASSNDGVLVDFYVYFDYNRNLQKDNNESFITRSQLYLEEVIFEEGFCNRNQAIKYYHSADTNPQTTFFLQNKKCYWITVVDKDFNPDTNVGSDYFWLRLNDEFHTEKLELPGNFEIVWLPSIRNVH